MPSLGTHLLVLDGAASQLAAGAPGNPGTTILENLPFASLGAVIQDVLYLVPDSSPRAEVVETQLRGFLELFEPFFEFESKYIDPLVAQLTNGANLATQGLYGDFVATSQAVAQAIETSIEAMVVQQIDPWEIILAPPPLSLGHREVDGANSWYWGDMVHYRQTGNFSQTLYDLAATPAERAFALGSATHIAGDVVLHPFVNSIVGGPYRNHPHRHHFVENLLDTVAWQRLRSANVLDAGLAERINVTGQPLPDTAAEIIAGVNLPDNLIGLLDKTLRTVYPVPPMRLSTSWPAAADYNVAYELFLLLSTLASQKLDPPQPPSISLASLNNLLQQIGFTPPPGLPGQRCKTFLCLEDLLTSIVNFINWGLEQLQKISQLAAAVLANLAVDAAKYLLYLIQSVLYNVYRASRRVLVEMGLMMPFDYDEALDIDQDYTANLELSQGRSLLSSGPIDPAYPHLTPPHPNGYVSFHHLSYPTTPAEQPLELSALVYGDVLVDLIQGTSTSPLAQQVNLYLSLVAPMDTASEAAFAISQIPPDPSLGSAVSFATYLIQQQVASPSALQTEDWNLDSDRGYAFRDWTWGPDAPLPGSPGSPSVDARYNP
jgi:hypothetical protein